MISCSGTCFSPRCLAAECRSWCSYHPVELCRRTPTPHRRILVYMAPREVDNNALRDAYEDGRRDGLRDAAPLPDLPGRSRPAWTEQGSRIEGYLRYEEEAIGALHAAVEHRERRLGELQWAHEELTQAQEALTEQRRRPPVALWRRVLASPIRAAREDVAHAATDRKNAEERLAACDAHIAMLGSAISQCRYALDLELQAASRAPSRAAGLRREPYKPRWVHEYPDVEAFIAEDKRRALPDYPARRDAGGADYDYDWTLEDIDQPRLITQWRISWLSAGGETDEIYARERRSDVPGACDSEENKTLAGRVWLLGRLSKRDAGDAVDKALDGVSMKEGRNTLVAAVESIRSVLDDDTASAQQM